MAGLVGAFLHLAHNFANVIFRNRRWTVFGTTHKASDLVGVLDQVPCLVVHDHLDQHVARKKLALGGAFLAILHLNHFFSGNQNAAKFVLHFGALNALDDVALHSLFHT